MHADVLATLVVARIEQSDPGSAAGDRTLRWTNAGHLPPVLIDAEGTPALLERPAKDLLLGVAGDATRTDHTATLPPGSTVLLYTDGLVERRGENIDDGLRRLLGAVARRRDLPLSDLLDSLVDELVAGRPTDDIALLAVRFHPQDEPRPAEAGPAHR